MHSLQQQRFPLAELLYAAACQSQKVCSDNPRINYKTIHSHLYKALFQKEVHDM